MNGKYVIYLCNLNTVVEFTVFFSRIEEVTIFFRRLDVKVFCGFGSIDGIFTGVPSE